MELDIGFTFVDMMEIPSDLFLGLEMILFSLTLRLEDGMPWLSLKISRSLFEEETETDSLDLETRRIE